MKENESKDERRWRVQSGDSKRIRSNATFQQCGEDVASHRRILLLELAYPLRCMSLRFVSVVKDVLKNLCREVSTAMIQVAKFSSQECVLSVRSHFLVQASSCSNVHDVVLFTSFAGFVLSKVTTIQFIVSIFSHSTCERLNGCADISGTGFFFVTLKGQDSVPVRWGRKSMKCSYKLRSCRY